MELRETLDKNMTEEEFSKQIEGLLDLYGWHWTHFRPARRLDGSWRTAVSGHKGFMDYVAVREGRLLFLEIKSEKGIVSDEQSVWLTALAATRAEVYVWKPSQWDEIVSVLRENK